MKIELGKTEVELLPEKAVFLPAVSTLILSDVHLGKAATFRKSGIPIPDGDDAHDLQRITALVQQHAAQHLIIAGDLFHSPAGLTPELRKLVDSWMEELSASVTLVIGNHDKVSLRRSFNMSCLPSVLVQDVEVVHDPADVPKGSFAICGHIHPVVTLKLGRSSSRLPCFHLKEGLLTLPSFGSLTGGMNISSGRDASFFVPSGLKVIQVPLSALF